MRKMTAFQRVFIGLGLALVCFSVLIAILLRNAMQPHVGRNVSFSQCPISGLPNSATHICYCYAAFAPVKVYEFDISELDFKAWAKSNGWELSPIVPGEDPWHIERYGDWSYDVNDPKEMQIKNGYRYEWVNPAPDSSDNRRLVGYDLDGHRAYYEYDSR